MAKVPCDISDFIPNFHPRVIEAVIEKYLKPEKVIVNGTHTVCVWKDGMKTIVNLMEGDNFNIEFAVAMCIVKKVLPNHNAFKRLVENAHIQPLKENKDAL